MIAEGQTLVVKSKDKVERGVVTVKSVDHATRTVTFRDPVPAGTVAGDTIEEIPAQEWEGLARH